MTTASTRVTHVDKQRNLYHRVESGLEDGALVNFMLRADIKAIKAQHGPLKVVVEGKKKKHIFDFLLTFDVGRDRDVNVLVAVRPQGSSLRKLEAELQPFRNQLSKFGVDHLVLLTDEDITKAVVNRANDFLRSRETKNERHVSRVFEHLSAAGKSLHVYELFDLLPDLVPSEIWSALMALLDKGEVEHDHDRSEKVDLSWLSSFRVMGEV